MGKITFVGRTDTALKDNFGICLFQAKNIEEAENFCALDPVIQNEIMTMQVFPFKLLVASEELKKWNVW